MLKLHSVVKLKNDDEKTGIRAGTEGVVVYIHADGEAYTVEFFGPDDETIESSFEKEFTEDELEPLT